MSGPLEVRCPNLACGRIGHVPVEFQGRSSRCPACGEKFHVPSPSEAPASPSPSGEAERIGRFELRARVGAGAFGGVYRAYDPRLEREVALKVPHPGTLDSPRRVERFLREARSAALLRHPCIVPVYEAEQDGDCCYIVSAFIAGTTLEQAHDESPLTVEQSARTVRDLAEALAYAHEQGVVHRDVKPANVLLDGQGRPHLADFGLAHRLDEAEKLTQDGAVMGTPAYMSPEQASGRSAAAGPASDQYSLGALFYELLTGQTPFSGPPQTVLFNAVHSEPPPPRTLRAGLPRDLETVCLKALAKRPEERYPDCQALADDLRRWLEGEPIHARRLGLGERALRWCRREPRLVAATGVALLCLAALALVASVSWAGVASAKRRTEDALREEAEQKERAEELARSLAAKLKENDFLNKSVAEQRKERQRFEQYLVALRQGDRAMHEGKYDEAVDHYQRARQLAPPRSVAEAVAASRLAEARARSPARPEPLAGKPPKPGADPPGPLPDERKRIRGLLADARKALAGNQLDRAEDLLLQAIKAGTEGLALAAELRNLRGQQNIAAAKREVEARKKQQKETFASAFDVGKDSLKRNDLDTAAKHLGAAWYLALTPDDRKEVEGEWQKLNAEEIRLLGQAVQKKTAESRQTFFEIGSAAGTAKLYTDQFRPTDALLAYQQITTLQAKLPDQTGRTLLASLVNLAQLQAQAKRDQEAARTHYTANLRQAQADFIAGKYPESLLRFGLAIDKAPGLKEYFAGRKARDDRFVRLLASVSRLQAQSPAFRTALQRLLAAAP